MATATNPGLVDFGHCRSMSTQHTTLTVPIIQRWSLSHSLAFEGCGTAAIPQRTCVALHWHARKALLAAQHCLLCMGHCGSACTLPKCTCICQLSADMPRHWHSLYWVSLQQPGMNSSYVAQPCELEAQYPSALTNTPSKTVVTDTWTTRPQLWLAWAHIIGMGRGSQVQS